MLFTYFRRVGLALACLSISMAASGEQTLVYCTTAAPEGFDPALYTARPTFNASSRQIYNRLLEIQNSSTALVPALATAYKVSEDGLQYTFYLRSGVKFHTTDYFAPTRDLTAKDIVFSLERQLLAEHPYHSVSGGTWEYFNGMSMPELIASIEAIDDLTVRLTLTRAYAPLIANLAMDFASVVSEEYAMQLLEQGQPELLTQRPIGTGPFAFQAYDTDIGVRYAAHNDYWDGKAEIDSLIFSVTPGSEAGHEQLKNGECDVLGYPSADDIATMQNDDGVAVVGQVGLNIGYLAYNTQLAPFDNAAVRRALNLAINKSAIVDAVFQANGEVANSPIPPSIWSYDKSLPVHQYDPEKARRLLEQEGVDKLQMQIWMTPAAQIYNPNARQTAEAIKTDLGKIGVEVEVVSFERGEFLKRSRELTRPGAVLFGWTGDNGDPDNFLAVLLGCDAVGNANRAQWCYEPFDALIKEAKIVTDQSKRQALYEKAQVIFNEQAPWATIAHSIKYKSVRSDVQGFAMDPFGAPVFHRAYRADYGN